jgi:hypothetical protein
MAVKSKVQVTDPRAQAGAYISTPGGLRAFCLSARNNDVHQTKA